MATIMVVFPVRGQTKPLWELFSVSADVKLPERK